MKYLYSALRLVSRKQDTKSNLASFDEAGGFSGTSGRQNPSHVCISAREKAPDSFNVLWGLAESKL